MNVRSDTASTIVRTATLPDAPRVAELSGQLGYPATPEEVALRLRKLEGDARHVVYVTESPCGEVIGWIHVQDCHLVESDTRAEVTGLVVAEGLRSRGAVLLLHRHTI